jgi:hypothetical protein
MTIFTHVGTATSHLGFYLWHSIGRDRNFGLVQVSACLPAVTNRNLILPPYLNLPYTASGILVANRADSG